MGSAFIVRRGGGGSGLSKCSIVIHVETGSTVAAYSDVSATTKVKDAKEIGTVGSYLISGLELGTYYIKATKGTYESVSSAIVFTSYGIKSVELQYGFIVYRDGVVNPLLGQFVKVGESSSGDKSFGVQSTINLSTTAYSNTACTLTCKFENAVDVTTRSTIHIRAKNSYTLYSGSETGNDFNIGINTSGSATMTRSISVAKKSDYADYTIDVSDLTGNYYLLFYSRCNTSGNATSTGNVIDMWIE